MAQPAKFNFDLDLSKATRDSQLIEDKELNQMLARARAEGHAEGLAEGEKSAQTQAMQQLVAAAQNLANQAGAFNEAMDHAQQEHLANAAQLGATVGKKNLLNIWWPQNLKPKSTRCWSIACPL